MPADPWTQHRQFRVNESADKSNRATDQPGSEHEHRSVDLPRHDRWINKDSRPNDSSHHDHGGVERAQPARERRFFVGGIQAPHSNRWPPNLQDEEQIVIGAGVTAALYFLSGLIEVRPYKSSEAKKV